MPDTPIGSNQLNLTFNDLSYYVRTGLFKKDKKHVLSNVCGDFRPGELTAIMGPSGAGKSTLMDILSGFTTSGVTDGAIRVNGRERNLAAFRRSSAYIMQDDNLQPLLTVQEYMGIAANLKLEPETSEIVKKTRHIILREMSLDAATIRETRTADLSGGQKKRLAIALELISNPPIMFFDEPTSGLDSVTSRQCIGLLKSLAQEGRTVVCSIHQPSATLFDMIDHLYVVVGGYCVYAGGTRNLLPYLESIGLRCPTYHNPADFLLEIVNGDYGDYLPRLIRLSENGKNLLWRSSRKDRKTILSMESSPKLPLSATPILYECEDRGSAYYATSSWRQLGVLLKRNAIRLSRDRVLTFMRLTMHLLVALIISTLFYQIGQDAVYALNNFNLLFFSIMFLMFSAFSATLITFPAELPILTREHFNRWYKLRSFYMANRLADLPVQITAISTYTLIMYFMTGQILEFKRMAMFIIMCVLVSLIAQIIGLIVGTSLDIQNGAIFGPFVIMPYVVFSGFFVHLNDAPIWLKWLFHVSFLKYGFEGVMVAIYGYDRPKMQCSEDYCHFRSPKVLLNAVDMKHSDYWFASAILFGLYVTLDLVAYFVLRWKLKARACR